MTTTALPGGAPATRTAVSKAEAQRIAEKINAHMAQWPSSTFGPSPFQGARVMGLHATHIADTTLWVPVFDKSFHVSLVFVVDERDQVKPLTSDAVFIQRDLYPEESEKSS